jgi:c-di-GMP-binding flagellar brake protein YcgR
MTRQQFEKLKQTNEKFQKLKKAQDHLRRVHTFSETNISDLDFASYEFQSLSYESQKKIFEFIYNTVTEEMKQLDNEINKHLNE